MAESELATLGGGCFWCVEAPMKELRGVREVTSGYAGGHVENPTYRQVMRGHTGHAEVVQISYDPEQVSYRELLEVFFTLHDPTTLNRQGPDVGPQYRSIVLYHDEAQRRTAQEVIRQFEADGVWNDPIVTEVVPYDAFYSAEAYHQEYYENNPQAAYCRVVIRPKIMKLQKEFLDELKQ